MARIISAATTPVFKFGIPALCLWRGIALATDASVAGSGMVMPPAGIVVSLLTVVVWLWFTWLCANLKRVALTDDALHLSNFFREIVVPLCEVDRISQRRLEINAVAIHFARRTDFGRRILFLPRRRGLPFTWNNPIVHRLRDAVAAAKRKEASNLSVEPPVIAG